MKLIIVHISDMHFTERLSPLIARVDQIAQVFKAHRGHDAAVLVYSGDIADMGLRTEYDLAGKFFDALLDRAQASFACPVYEMFTPGNHDVDLEGARRSRLSAIEELKKNFSRLSAQDSIALLEECAEAQGAFWSFVRDRGNALKVGDSHGTLAITYQLPGFPDVQFFGLNTAAMTVRHETQGHLLVHPGVIPSRPDGCEIFFAVMHHPLNWFESWNSRELGESLSREAEVVLTGHEHLSGATYHHGLTQPGTVYLHGDVMQERSTGERKSGFAVLGLCTASRELTIHNYTWEAGQYGRMGEVTRCVLDKPSTRASSLQPSEVFENVYLRDTGTAFIHPSGRRPHFDDLYVEPLVVERSITTVGSDKTEVVVNAADIVGNAATKPYALIQGPELAGKSAYLKRLWRLLHEANYKPVRLSFDNAAHSIGEHDLNVAIDRQYGTGASDAYWRLDQSKLACLVDDIHVLASRQDKLEGQLKLLTERFGIVICSATDLFVVGEIVRRSGTSSVLSDFRQCSILPFGHRQRGELIERWIDFQSTYNDDDRQRVINQAEAIINTLLDGDLIPSAPLFVISVLQSLDAVRENPNVMGAHAYHYETMIRAAINSSLQNRNWRSAPVTRETLEVQAAYVAYFLHHRGSRSLTVVELEDLISAFRAEGPHRFSIGDMLTSLQLGEVLLVEGAQVKFRYQHTYQYFVAKRFQVGFARVDERNEYRTQLDQILENLQSQEFASIAMLILYLNPDGELIGELTRRADLLYAGLDHCNLASDLNFASKGETFSNKAFPEGSQAENRRQLRLRRDEAMLERANEGKPSDDNVSGTLGELNRALKTVEVMGQVLKNYPATLGQTEKARLVQSSFRLGLRTLTSFTELVKLGEAEVKEHLRRITEGQCHPDQLALDEGRLSQLVANLVFLGSYGIVKRIGKAIGSDQFDAFLRPMDGEGLKLARELTKLSVSLDQMGSFPADDLETMAKQTTKEGHIIAYAIARELTWEHMLLYPVDPAKRQQVIMAFGFRSDDPRTLGLRNPPTLGNYRRRRKRRRS